MKLRSKQAVWDEIGIGKPFLHISGMADETERWQGHLAARLHQSEGGAQTLAAFMERIDQLGQGVEARADERGEEILSALYDCAEQIAP